MRELRYKIVKYLQDQILIPAFRKSRFLSNFYYCLFSKEFSREHQKVLIGKYLHMQALKTNRPNEFHLRRQVHRLEKGMIMKNRKEVFAVDYIIDTVKNVEILRKEITAGNMLIDKKLLEWGYDVLEKYFSLVGQHPNIDEAKKIFEALSLKKGEAEKSEIKVPYYRKDRNSCSVTFDDFMELAMQRRSIRWFTEKKVDRSEIEKAISIATLSPSACNRQPFEFRIFDEKEIKEQVGAIPMGIKGFSENIPVIIVLIGKLSAYISERDRHVIYIDGGLAAMSFMLALETLGLSSVPVNWPDIEHLEKKMEETLKLAPDERPIMIMGVGHADPEGMIPFSQKKPPEVLSKYN